MSRDGGFQAVRAAGENLQIRTVYSHFMLITRYYIGKTYRKFPTSKIPPTPNAPPPPPTTTRFWALGLPAPTSLLSSA
jgi:hypothetical protein